MLFVCGPEASRSTEEEAGGNESLGWGQPTGGRGEGAAGAEARRGRRPPRSSAARSDAAACPGLRCVCSHSGLSLAIGPIWKKCVYFAHPFPSTHLRAVFPGGDQGHNSCRGSLSAFGKVPSSGLSAAQPPPLGVRAGLSVCLCLTVCLCFSLTLLCPCFISTYFSLIQHLTSHFLWPSDGEPQLPCPC